MRNFAYIDGPSVRRRTSVVFSPFRLDYRNQCLWRDNQHIELAPKAFAVLTYLVEAAGRLVTKGELLDSVWADTVVGDAVLKVAVGEIRRALRDESRSPRFIETLHRRGYRFIGSVDGSSVEQYPESETALRQNRPPLADARSHRHSSTRTPETRYARSGDLNIAYQVLGDGPLDLVFVMGWVSHLEYFWTEPAFARFLRRLASFSRLILFDKRGTGLSDRVPLNQLPTLEERIDDVRAVMEAAGSERAAICGVSEGGIMSALFAATYPSKTLALIMIGTYAKRLRDATYPWGPTPAEREQFYDEILTNWGGAVGLEERAPSAAHDPRFREWWATYLRMGASPGAALALTKMNTEIDARDVFKSVRTPTLVVHRTDDRCLLVEEGRYVASLIPQARFVELPGADHLPFVGDQDSVLDEVEQFLLGMHLSEESERVLTTVLYGRFSRPGICSTDAYQLLASDLRRQIEWFRGQEVRVDDQGAVAMFDGPARAVRCACAMAERASWVGLQFAAGLHTGECEFHQSGPDGSAVRIASEIANAARASEIIVSSTVRDLVAGSGIKLGESSSLEVGEYPGKLAMFRVQRSG